MCQIVQKKTSLFLFPGLVFALWPPLRFKVPAAISHPPSLPHPLPRPSLAQSAISVHILRIWLCSRVHRPASISVCLLCDGLRLGLCVYVYSGGQKFWDSLAISHNLKYYHSKLWKNLFLSVSKLVVAIDRHKINHKWYFLCLLLTRNTTNTKSLTVSIRQFLTHKINKPSLHHVNI